MKPLENIIREYCWQGCNERVKFSVGRNQFVLLGGEIDEKTDRGEWKMVFNNVFGGEMDIWPILPEGDIYRIVIDYSHSCYRVEDNRFRIIYAGDLPSGGSDSIIFALADRVPGEDRGRFLTAFSEKRLRNACAKNRREIKLICNRREDVGKRSIVRARIGGSPRDLCVELRYQL